MEKNKNLIPWKRNEVTSLFDAFDQELSNMFNRAFDDSPFWTTSIGKSSYPKVNIVDDADKYTIEATVPGLVKENVNVTVEDQNDGKFLVISANNSNTVNETKRNYIYREIKSSSFSRSFYLDNNVDSDKIEAAVKDGILTVTVPKITPATEPKQLTKKIEIK